MRYGIAAMVRTIGMLFDLYPAYVDDWILYINNYLFSTNNAR